MAAAAATMTTAALLVTHRRGEEDKLVWTTTSSQSMRHRLLCEEAPATETPIVNDSPTMEEQYPNETKVRRKHGFQPNAEGDYHGMFPARQLWKPAVEYPLWYGPLFTCW